MAHEMAGTITSSPRCSGRLPAWKRAATPTRFAAEPELTISACFAPNLRAKSSSKRRTFSPMVNMPLEMTRCIASISSLPQELLARS